MTAEKKKVLESTVKDLVGSLFYYDRKEDEDLTLEDMANLTDEDKDFICNIFIKEIKEEV